MCDEELEGYALLWNDTRYCIDQAREGQAILKRMGKILYAVSDSERISAQKLAASRKTTQILKPNTEPHSSMHTFVLQFETMFIDSMVNGRIILSQKHRMQAENIKKFYEKQRQLFRKLQIEDTELEKMLNSQLAVHNASLARYLKSCKLAEKSIAVRDKAVAQGNSKDIGKLWAKVKIAAAFCMEKEIYHKAIVESTRKMQLNYQNQKTRLAKDFEAMEHNRTEHLKIIFRDTVSSTKEYLNFSMKIVENFALMGAEVSSPGDTQLFLQRTVDDPKRSIKPSLVDFTSLQSEKVSNETKPPRESTIMRHANAINSFPDPGAIPRKEVVSFHEPIIPLNIDSSMVRVKYEYTPEDDRCLLLRIGDHLSVLEANTNGWMLGQKQGTDEIGLFPANYTEPVSIASGSVAIEVA